MNEYKPEDLEKSAAKLKEYACKNFTIYGSTECLSFVTVGNDCKIDRITIYKDRPPMVVYREEIL